MPNGNEQAFPAVDPTWYNEIKIHEEHIPGLTKREYFAAMALQGYIASWATMGNSPSERLAAGAAVRYADALVAALETMAPLEGGHSDA